MANETSAKVKVYPCAYRGQIEQSGVTYLYNPESRLPTEHNITEAVNNVSTVNNGSYIISPAAGTTVGNTTKLIFVIHGYRFEVDNIATVLADATIAAGNNIYANIKLAAKNTNTPREGNTDYLAMSLINYGNEATGLDVDAIFKGLEFTDELPTHADNLYSLLIATKVDGVWKTPSSSYLRLDTRDIADVAESGVVSDRNIHEAFTTGELSVSADTSIGGTLDVGGTLAVTGTTTLGNTLNTTGKLTVGSSTTVNPGAEVWGNLAVNGKITANATSMGGTGEIEAGMFTVDHAVGGIKPSLTSNGSVGTTDKHFGNSYINHTHTNQISEATSGSGITINNNVTLANGADINPSTTGSSLGSAVNRFGSVYANGFTGTLYGTTHLDDSSYSTDSEGEIKNLPSGWYIVEMRNGTLFRGACFTIYVPNTLDGIGTYYSPISDFYTTNTTAVEYSQIKLCAESTSNTTGKISIYVGSLFGNGQTGQIKYVYQKMGSQQTYTFHLTKIGSY